MYSSNVSSHGAIGLNTDSLLVMIKYSNISHGVKRQHLMFDKNKGNKCKYEMFHNEGATLPYVQAWYILD
jgi:hypothetical protein